MRNFTLFFLLLSAQFVLNGTEYAPWYGRDFELEFRESLIYETFDCVDQDTGPIAHYGRNFILNSSIAMAAMDTYAVELELALADTRKEALHLAAGKITGRYMILRAPVGDPCSLCVGGTLTFPTDEAVKDYNTLYRSNLEFELHAAVGQEYDCGPYWVVRGWTMGVVGIGDSGARPWLRSLSALEWNRCGIHKFSLIADLIYGFGPNPLNINDFKGYGKIHYQLIDLGASYTYLFCDLAYLTLHYSYRVHARHLPMDLHRIALTVMIPFGL